MMKKQTKKQKLRSTVTQNAIKRTQMRIRAASNPEGKVAKRLAAKQEKNQTRRERITANAESGSKKAQSRLKAMEQRKKIRQNIDRSQIRKIAEDNIASKKGAAPDKGSSSAASRAATEHRSQFNKAKSSMNKAKSSMNKANSAPKVAKAAVGAGAAMTGKKVKRYGNRAR